MPIRPTYPGVYVQEVSSGVRTITGVSTSTAGFFGRTAKGPINKAVKCTSYLDFLRAFGGAHPDNDLASSVKQFYDNGGSECFVVRLAHNAVKASVTLHNAAGVEVLTVSAKDAGNWGNGLRLEVDYNTLNPDETFNLSVIHEENGAVVASERHINLSMDPNSPRYAVNFVTQSSNLIDVALALIDVALAVSFDIESTPQVGYSESRRPFEFATVTAFRNELNALIYTPASAPSRFEISINNGPFVPIDLRTDPADLTGTTVGTMGTSIEGKINPQLLPGDAIAVDVVPISSGGNDYHFFRIRSNSGNNHSVRIRRSSSSANDIAAILMLGVEQGGVETARYANHRPVPTATYYSGDINEFANLTQDAFNELVVAGAPAPNTVDLDASGTSVLVTTAAGDRIYDDAATVSVNDNKDGVREKLQALAKAVNEKPNLPVKAEVWGYHLAFLPKTGTFNSSFDISTGDSGGGGTNIGNLFTKNARQYALNNAGSSDFQTVPGKNGLDSDGFPLAVTDYFGKASEHTGFYALDKVDIFNLMVLPGDTDIDESEYQQIAAEASIYCQSKRAFLLLDAPLDWAKNGNLNEKELKYTDVRSGVIKDFSAIFYPRVIFSDAGTLRSIGVSGMIAGLMARTDSQRGVWKAPAGTEADLRGALGVEVNLTDLENGILNQQGVNCVRQFPGGVVNWGARTLDGADDFGSEWKYIPIRRLALFLEESLYRGTKWVVFEPNDEPLWAKIRMNLNAFMTGLFRQGAFQGSTPDKAFFVKCDAETTTQNDRNLGIVNIQVGFAPLKPAEFVIITIQQIAGDL